MIFLSIFFQNAFFDILFTEIQVIFINFLIPYFPAEEAIKHFFIERTQKRIDLSHRLMLRVTTTLCNISSSGMEESYNLITTTGKAVNFFFSLTTISFIIFWDFSMFYQIFLSPQVKRWTIITYKHGIYELPHELPNDLRLRKLEN